MVYCKSVQTSKLIAGALEANWQLDVFTHYSKPRNVYFNVNFSRKDVQSILGLLFRIIWKAC
jgi:hypothetical protein